MSRKRITIDVEEELLATVDQLAAELASSRNRVIADALQELVRRRARDRVDREFERMAADAPYQAELMRIEHQSSVASDSAWKRLDPPARPPRKTPAARRRGAVHAAR